jgi:Lipocalin-like domain/Prokaryotic membrane lipoprotein lipid attachment site
MKKTILFAFVALALLAGCKKTKDQVCDLSEASIIGTYKLTGLTANGQSVLTVFLEQCELDDTYTFNADKSFVYTDAGIICAPPGTTSGNKWYLTGKIFSFDGTAYNVESFDCHSVILSDSTSGIKSVLTLSRQ